MRPLELELTAFRSYDRATIDLRPYERVVITGDTGAGKTSLLDAICFALFGRTPEQTRPRELLTLGHSHGEVRLTFSARGEVWRATRRYGRDAPEPAHLLERLVADGGPPRETVSGEGAVERRLSAVVGISFAAFTSAVLLTQGRFAQFLSSQPRDRDAILRELFGVASLEGARQAALVHAGAAQRQADLRARTPRACPRTAPATASQPPERRGTPGRGALPPGRWDRSRTGSRAGGRRPRRRARRRPARGRRPPSCPPRPRRGAADPSADGAREAARADGPAPGRRRAPRRRRRPATACASVTAVGRPSWPPSGSAPREPRRWRAGCPPAGSDGQGETGLAARRAELDELSRVLSQTLAEHERLVARAALVSARARRRDEAVAAGEARARLEAEARGAAERCEGAARALVAAERDHDRAHRHDLAATLRAGLAPGDACPVCGGSVGDGRPAPEATATARASGSGAPRRGPRRPRGPTRPPRSGPGPPRRTPRGPRGARPGRRCPRGGGDRGRSGGAR